LNDISFAIRRSEKVALVGVNGAGKSTLSRLISGSEPPSGGSIVRGENVLLGFFSQESAQNLTYDNSVFEEIQTAGGRANDLERRNLLGAFLFSGDAIHKKVGVLSGGEKSRLALLKLLLQETNCLILDEPTNHLDRRTKDIFQRALLGYSGTVIIVSHDRHFLDELVSRVFEIRDGGLVEYPGNYTYFIGKRQELEDRQAAQSLPAVSQPTPQTATPTEAPGRKSKEQRRQEAEERDQQNRQKRDLQKKIQTIEGLITELEHRKTALEAQLCDPVFLKESGQIRNVTLEHKLLGRQLTERVSEWETLLEHLETLNQALAAR
jgi:ATP-binding cassette, subfamily F, member 3